VVQAQNGTSELQVRDTTEFQQPGTSFSSKSNGDGWDVGFTSGGQVLNVYHHSNTFAWDCHLKDSTGSQCPGTWPQRISGYATSYQSYTIVVKDTLYSWVMSADKKGGVVKLKPEGGDFSFHPLTDTGETGMNFQTQSGPVGGARIGDNIYAINNCPGRGQTDASDCNKILCFDTKARTACPGQPFALEYPDGWVMPNKPSETAWIYAVGGNLYTFQINKPGVANQRGIITCTTVPSNQPCKGSWPVNVPDSAMDPRQMDTQVTSMMGYLNNGICIGGGTSAAGGNVPHQTGGSQPYCWTSAGRAVGSLNIKPQKVSWGPLSSLSFANRGYFGSSNGVACVDFATNRSCDNFPIRDLIKDTSTYSVRSDPTNPRCLWINGDSGYIANFDAYTGEKGCGSMYYTTVTFGLDLPSNCYQILTQWSTFRITDPVGFGTAKVTIFDLDGVELTTFTYIENTEQDISSIPSTPDIIVKTEFSGYDENQPDNFSARVSFDASDKVCCPTGRKPSF
jgi:hypothetical protein